MQTERYKTTLGRASAAVPAGAAVGALVTNAPTLVIGLLMIGEPGGFRSQDIPFIFFMLAVAFAVWAVGLALVGAPIWWIFHRKGWRSRRTAVLVGAVATFLVGFGINAGFSMLRQLDSGSSYSAGDSGGMTIINDQLTAHGWWNAIQGSILLAVVGVIVALVIWRIAYRPVRA